MTSPRFPEDIFNDALELPPEQRTEFARRMCGDNRVLLEEVEALLRLVDQDPGLVDFPVSSTKLDETPTNIDRFRVLERCGAGGMGIVYKAEDPTLGRVVALKVLSPSRVPIFSAANRMQTAQAWLEEEARCLATLNHPNVATIHALEYDGETPFLVMEYVEGQTLADLLQQETVDPRERLRISHGIAMGVDAAHQRGIIHRDLKPGNVMVTPGGIVKVLDFGIAKVVELAGPEGPDELGRGPSSAHPTLAAGTPGYMSPEQVRRERIDHRADIWALGRLLCDIFDGAPVDPGIGWDSGVRMKVRGMNGNGRRRLEKLAGRCVRSERDARPESMRQVCDEIAQIIDLQRGVMRYRILWRAAAGVGLLVLVVLAVRFVQHRRAFPLAAKARGQSVQVEYSDRSTSYFMPPGKLDQPIDSARVVEMTGQVRDRVVLGWSGRNDGPRDVLYAWNRHGRCMATIPTTDDNPFLVSDEVDSGMYTRRWVSQIYGPSASSRTLDVVEIGHYFPSVFRRFAVGGSTPIETYRLYHAGHIDKVVLSAGFTPGQECLWLTGRVRDGGVLREAAGGHEGNTHFLACLDAPGSGTEVWPLFEAPDAEFKSVHPEGVRSAEPILYFVIRGYDWHGGLIDWEGSGQMFISAVSRRASGGIDVLLANTIRLELIPNGPENIHVGVSMTGQVRKAVENQFGRPGVPGEVTVTSFLADSVIYLAAARPGLTVTGDFTDIRNQIPASWVASAIPGVR